MSAIGVLDLQGGVAEHLEHLETVGVPAVRVKTAADFQDISGLIIPGGESTCLSRLLRIFGLDQVILDAYAQGLKLWGTCAGAIILANDVAGETPCLQLMDIQIKRNAFGSQLDSFNRTVAVPEVAAEPVPLVFIRAPKILKIGSAVKTLIRMDDWIAAAEDANSLVSVFHPELGPSTVFHAYFARKCGLQPKNLPEKTVGTDWERTRWMRFAPIPR